MFGISKMLHWFALHLSERSTSFHTWGAEQHEPIIKDLGLALWVFLGFF